jgi:CheY-like chemotaxis protein
VIRCPAGANSRSGLRDLELDKIGVAAHPGLACGGYVELAIGDTGAGMDARPPRGIFEPFFTTKGDVTGPGSAYTVYAIVHQNNGAIEVQSRLGHGTTFYVYLPRATDLGKPAPIRSTAGTETILLVEDDDRVRALVANMLAAGLQGAAGVGNRSGAADLRRASGHIHLGTTDVVMPGLSGRVLAERLAATLPHTPVLYMSEEPDHEVLRRGVRKGSACFIQKPFSIDALGHKVRETLSTAAHISTVGRPIAVTP